MCFGSRRDVDEDVSITSTVSLRYLPPGGSTQSTTTSFRARSHGTSTGTTLPKPTQARLNLREAPQSGLRQTGQARGQAETTTLAATRAYQPQGQAYAATLTRRSEAAGSWSPPEQVKPLVARQSLSSLPDTTKRPSLQQTPSNQDSPFPPLQPRNSTIAAPQPAKSMFFSPTGALRSSSVLARTNTTARTDAKAAAVATPPEGVLHSRTRSSGSPRPRPVNDKVFRPLSRAPGKILGSVPVTKDKEEEKTKPEPRTTTRPASSSSSISNVSTVSSVSLDADDHAITRQAAVKSALRSMLSGGSDSNSPSDIDPEMVVLVMRKRAQKEAKQAEKVRAKREAKMKENNGPKDFRARVQELRKQRAEERIRQAEEKAKEDAEAERAKKPLRDQSTGTEATMTSGTRPMSSSTSASGGVERSTPLGVIGDLLEYKRLEENKKNARERLGRFAGPALEPITFKQFLEKKAREDPLRALSQGLPGDSSSSSKLADGDTTTSLPRNRLVRPAAASTKQVQEGPKLKVPVSVSASKTTPAQTPAPTSAHIPEAATVPKGKIATPEVRNRASVSSTLRKSTSGPVFKVPPLPEFQRPAIAPVLPARQNVPSKYLPDLRLNISIRGADAPGAISAADISDWRKRLSGNKSEGDIMRLRSDLQYMRGTWTSAELPMVAALVLQLGKTILKARSKMQDREAEMSRRAIAKEIGAF